MAETERSSQRKRKHTMTKQIRITVDNLLVDTIVGLYIAVGRWLSR